MEMFEMLMGAVGLVILILFLIFTNRSIMMNQAPNMQGRTRGAAHPPVRRSLRLIEKRARDGH